MKKILLIIVLLLSTFSFTKGTHAQTINIKTEEELIEAIARNDVSEILIDNNIEITTNTNIEFNQYIKKINGKGYTLSSNKYIRINALDELHISNIELNFTGEIKTNNNSFYDNVKSKINLISNSGKVNILNSEFESIRIYEGNNTEIKDSTFNGSIMIHRTQDFLIDNVSIKSTGNGITVGSGSGAVSGKIQNSTIEASEYGIYTDLYGEVLEVENVKLINNEYGIYHNITNGGGLAKLNNVEIINPSKYAIYVIGNNGTYTNRGIKVLDNSKLKMETNNNVAIYLENGGTLAIGNNVEIEHIGTNYTAYKDNFSSITMEENTLYKQEIANSTWEGYYTKENYPDVIKPEIFLNGNFLEFTEVNSNYEEKGGIAIDDIDGQINLIINSKVDTSKTGIYEIEYTAIDSHNNTNTITRTVVVYQIKINNIKELNVGEQLQLDYSIEPNEYFKDKTLTWKSSDETIAKVDNKGIITAHKRGKVTISVTTSNNISDEFELIIKEPKVLSINVEKTEYNLTIESKDFKIEPVINTQDNPKYEVTWKSSNEKVVTVTNGEVKIIGTGSSTITITAGEVTKEIKVNIGNTNPIFEFINGIIDLTKSIIKKITSNLTAENFYNSIKNNQNVSLYNSDGNLICDVSKKSTELVGTDYYIEYIDNKGKSVHFDLSINGDLSGDGEVDSLDLATMLNHIAGKKELTGAYLESAYLNKDEDVDSLDLAYLLNHIAGKEGY